MSSILGAVGPKGSGKTCLLVAVAMGEHNRGRRIVSNFKLNMPHKPLVFPESEEQDIWLSSGYRNCLILLDEAQMYANARRSAKSDNMAVSWLLQQSRKLGVDVFWSTQYPRQVDVLIREHTDAVFECENKGEATVCQVWFPRGHADTDKWNAGPRFAFDRRKVYSLFNSYEVITRVQA